MGLSPQYIGRWRQRVRALVELQARDAEVAWTACCRHLMWFHALWAVVPVLLPVRVSVINNEVAHDVWRPVSWERRP